MNRSGEQFFQALLLLNETMRINEKHGHQIRSRYFSNGNEFYAFISELKLGFLAIGCFQCIWTRKQKQELDLFVKQSDVYGNIVVTLSAFRSNAKHWRLFCVLSISTNPHLNYA